MREQSCSVRVKEVIRSHCWISSGKQANRSCSLHVRNVLESGEFCVWPKLNTRGYPSTLWLPTERVRRKGYPLAQADCTPCAQASGLCVWLTPPPLQAAVAACDPHSRCAHCVGYTAQNHRRFVSPHRGCARCLEWGR